MADNIALGIADYLANREEPVAPKLRDSLMYGVDQNPDTHAKMKTYARNLGVALPAAFGDPKYVETQGRVQDLDPNGMVLGSPKTANWLTTPDNAAMAHDDVPVLKQIENVMRGLGGLGKAAALGAGAGGVGLKQAFDEFIQGAIARNTTDASGQPTTPAAMQSMFGADNAQVVKTRQGLEKGAKDATPQTDSLVLNAVNSGIVSLAQNLPLTALAVLTKNPEIALAGMSAMTGGQAYGQARDAGKSPDKAGAFGTIQGLIEGATELLPMHALIGDVAKGTGFFKTVMKQLALEMPGEQIATLTQDLNEQLTLHPEKTLGQYLAERPNAALSTAIATAVGVAGQSSVGHLTGLALQRADQEQAKAEQAGQVHELLEGLNKAATASALRARDPQTFHDYVAAVTEDAPVDRVYINAQDLVDTLAQGSPDKFNENVAALQAMPSVMPQLEDAVKSGGLVEIPLAELLAYTPDTALGQALMQHLKVDPQAHSMAEAEAFMQSSAEGLQADVAKAIDAGGVADGFQASAERVNQSIRDNLTKVNRFTPDVNETYVHMLGSFYAAGAVRMGVTPEAFQAQHPVQFQAQGVTDGSLMSSAKAILGEEVQADGQGVLFPVLPLQLPAEADGSLRIENAFGGYTPGALNYAKLNRDQVRTMNELRDAKTYTKVEVPLRDLVVTQRTVNPDFAATKTKGKGDLSLPAVYKVNGQYVLADGHHRATAALAAGKAKVMARVYDVDAEASPTDILKQGGREYPMAPRSEWYGEANYAENGGQLVEMSPGDYLAKVRPLELDETARDNIDDLKQHIENGGRLDPLKIFADGKEDGRHRAIAAQELGIARVPVVVFGGDLYQSEAHWTYEPGLGFQSALFNTVQEKGQARAPAAQWLAMLQNAPGVKKEELEWIGLPEALALLGAQGPVAKEQVLTYIAQNGVRLEEVVLGGEPSEDAIQARAEELENQAIENNHFESVYYVTEGDAEDERTAGKFVIGPYEDDSDIYGSEEEAQEAADDLNLEAEREWLNDQGFHSTAESELRENNGARYGSYQAIKGGENYRELLLVMPQKWERPTGLLDGDTGEPIKGLTNPTLTRSFTAGMGHWEHDNVLAHTRLADFQSPDGKRVLGVLEIQSDWHQKGRDKGYAVAASPEEVAKADATFKAAVETRNTYGEALIDLMPGLMLDRIAELEAVRDAKRSEEQALEAALADLTVYAYDSPARNEQIPRKNELARQAQGLSDQINDLKRLRGNLVQWPGEHGPRPELYGMASRIAGNNKSWGGTEFVERFVEMHELRDSLNQAELKVQEADQRLKQARGEGGIPDAPFKASWPALVMKRLLRMAVEGGYDQVAWATGEQQADLYDMRNFVDEVAAEPASDMPDDTRVSIYFPGQGSVPEQIADSGVGEMRTSDNTILLTRDQAASLFGGELGHRIYDQTMAGRGEPGADGYYAPPSNARQRFAGVDLTVGGEGHKAFYNRNLVNITNDIIKKLDGKVKPTQIKAGTEYFSADVIQREINARQARIDELRRERDEHPGTELARTLGEEIEYAEGNQAADQEALDKATPTVWGFEITEAMRTEQAAVQPKLFQGEDPAKARGAFNPAASTITLLRNADLSTALHELGHFYLETLARIAAEPTAPQEFKDDWAKAASYIGFGGVDPAAWLAIPVDGRRESHETWARSFEAYLREGKAPSAALKGPFQRFKAWLVHIYQSVAQLRVELTDEVRGVFDRLLATEAEIAQAEAGRHFAPVLETKPAGMSDLEWASYQRLGADATADAQDALGSRSLRDMQWLQNARSRMIRKLAGQAREKRKAVKAEIEAELNAEPVYAAQQFLRRGVLDGQPWEGVHKLDTEEVAAIYEGTPAELQDWRKLGFGKYGMLSKDGMTPDQAAELFGFSSGHELVEALLSAPPAREEIEGRTDQRMLERYGDLKDPAAIERAADEAIHNDARLRFVATEANALAQATGKVKLLAEAARDFARNLIGRQRIRDLKPAKYTGAETRAAVAAAKAAAKGDLVTAATEKRNQLINGYAAKAAFEAEDEIDKALRYLKRFESVATRKGLDADYRDQIDALLERFDLRTGQTLKAIDKRKALAAWVKAQEDQGFNPILDDALLNEAYRKHYRDLSVDEMRGLVDAVKNIAHLGRLKHKLLVAAKGRAFKAVVDESEAAIRDNAYKTIPDKIESNRVVDRMLSGMANFAAIHRKFASLVREMGGLANEGGILWRAFIEPMNKANDKEAAMRERATMSLSVIYQTLKVKKGELRRKLFIPEIGRSLTLEGRLAVALNWGNELNRARIMDGDKWDADQVQAILRTLTPNQAEFVNQMWEYLDSFWPEIAAKERRVTGVEPAKVEAEAFELALADGTTVQMRGGYYPIKYDTNRSSRSEADEFAESVRATMMGAYTRATTRRGHTKARVEKVERPVRKDLLVPFGHVNQVIHDLAFHEYLIDANRLMAAPQIDAAIRDHYGVETLRTIKKTLEAMAEGDAPTQDSFEKAMNHVRTGATIVGLGLNLTSAMLQPLGLAQSIVRIGPKYVAKGIGRAFADAASLQNTMKEISEKSEFMRLRAKTFMREVSEVQNQVRDSLKPKVLTAVEASYFMLIQKFQLIADVPTWLGQYEKSLDQGADEDTAVGLADQAVRDSQGGGQIGDLAQIQRGNVWFKLWTNFYSFFSVGYNQMAESIGETRRVGASRLPLLAVDVLLVAVAPAMMGELLKKALRGDDDWDWEKLGPALLKAQVSYLLGFMVGLRELGGMVQNDGKAANGPAALRLLTQDMPRLYQQIEQGEWDDAARKSALNVTGAIFHFPAGQINRTIDGIEALARGDTQNPLAVLVGPPRKA